MRRLKLITGLVITLILLMLSYIGLKNIDKISNDNGVEIAEQAIKRAAVSIYSTDGAYPCSYEQLKSKVNLSINEDKFIVFYEIFASNIAPNITVIEAD